MSSSSFLKKCPKSGRVIGISPSIPGGRLMLPLLGFFALVWVVLRTGSKPSRLSYPCQQTAAPLATWFVSWLVGGVASVKLLRMGRMHLRGGRLVAALMAFCGCIGVLIVVQSGPSGQAFAQNGAWTGLFTPKDAVNSPIGVARGIHPGRVSWIRDSLAVKFSGSGNWTAEQNFDNARLDNMLRRLVMSISDKPSLKKSWDTLFQINNKSRNRGDRGYKAGEKIAIKINLNNGGSSTLIDQTPQMVRALLAELVDSLGVAQSDILVFDAMRLNAAGAVRSACVGRFPNVRYNNISHPAGDWADTLKYSNNSIDPTARQIPRWVAQADYMINLAILKRHAKPEQSWTDPVGQTGITVTAKNHCGTTRNCGALHGYFRDWYTGDKKYNVLVDMMSSNLLAGKTVLYLVDGLLTGSQWGSGPVKWKMTPFNGNYPASLFASQDQVAMESVALDFLSAEMRLTANADNFLHEAAQIGSPPSGTNYVNKGSNTSMGVHEHWNNPVDKKYSRDLGTGKGIELFKVPLTGPTSSVEASANQMQALEFSFEPGSIIVVTSKSALVSAEIFNASGQQLASNALSGNTARIRMPGSGMGAYVRVRTMDGTVTRRL